MLYVKLLEERSESGQANLNPAHEKDDVKAGQLAEGARRAVMVAFGKRLAA